MIRELDNFAEKSQENKEFRKALETIKINEKSSYGSANKFVELILYGWGWEIESMSDKDEKFKQGNLLNKEKEGVKLFAKLLRKNVTDESKETRPKVSNKVPPIAPKSSRLQVRIKNLKEKEIGEEYLYPHPFMKRVLKIVKTEAPILESRLKSKEEINILELIEKVDWTFSDKYKIIFEAQTQNINEVFRTFSKEEQAALFYILAGQKFNILSDAIKKEGVEIKQLVQEAIIKDAQIEKKIKDRQRSNWLGEQTSNFLEEKEFERPDFVSDEEDDTSQTKVKKNSRQTKQDKSVFLLEDIDNSDEFQTDEEDGKTRRKELNKTKHTATNKANSQNIEGREINEQYTESNTTECLGEFERISSEDVDIYKENADDWDFLADIKRRPDITITDDLLRLEGVEEGIDYETLSFCSNSDIAEHEYTNHEEHKTNEHDILNTFYDKDLVQYLTPHIFDELSNVIMIIPDQSFPDILGFFATENCFDVSYPGFPNVCVYFRQLEALMVNSVNQGKLLHFFTVIINCNFQDLNFAQFDTNNFLFFMVNVLKFLQYYARTNPTCFFEYSPQILSQYNLDLQMFLKPNFPLEKLTKITKSPLFNRILTACPKELYRRDGLLREKVVNVAAYLAKVAFKEGYNVELNEEEIDKINEFIRSKHCWKSFPFQRRLGKLLSYLGTICKSHNIIALVESEFIKDRLPPLVDFLTKSWESVLNKSIDELNMMDEGSCDESGSKNNMIAQSLRPLRAAIATFYNPELERFYGILKYLDYRPGGKLGEENNGNGLYLDQKIIKDVDKFLTIIFNSLIKFRDLLNNNMSWFFTLLSVIQPYLFSVIHLFRDQEDPLRMEEITKLKEIFNLVFDRSSRKLSRDQPLLTYMGSSFLKTLLDLETKEKIMR